MSNSVGRSVSVARRNVTGGRFLRVAAAAVPLSLLPGRFDFDFGDDLVCVEVSL